MGRGNVCTHNEYEGLYYLDKDLLEVYRKVKRCSCGHVTGFDLEEEPQTARELHAADIEYDFHGSLADWKYDEHDSRNNWDNMIEYMCNKLMSKFSSFSRVDTWKKREQHIVLRSTLFEIAVVDNEWSAAWCLLKREDIYDYNRALMRRHYPTYLEAIKTALIEGWGEAIGYGGAWVSGKKYTKEDIA